VKLMRPYQLDASAAILDAWKEHKSCIATVATGGGKTLIAAGLTKKLVDNGGRVLFLANRNELCLQPLAAFREQGVIASMEKAEDKASLGSNVVIGSVQTLTRKNRLDRFPRDHFSHVFCDEAHGATAASFKRIFDHFTTAKLCGITATSFRADGKSLSEIFQTECYRKDLFDLVDEGFLVSPDHVHKLSTAVSLANVRIKHTPEGRDFDVNDAADAIEPYFVEIAREIKARFSDRHILAFLPLIASSKKFTKACVSEGINAMHVDGDDPLRNEKLQLFREGQVTLLSNANLLHTGIDAPACDATLNLRPTKSKVLYTQIVGRSTRTVPGTIDGIDSIDGRLEAIKASRKPNALILDPLWLTREMDLVSPAYLVASDQEQVDAIAKATKGKHAFSLIQVKREIQAEKEATILRRLQDVANFRDRKVSAKWFAAATKNHELVNYEPIYGKEKKPTSNLSRLLLEGAGINPDSVSSEGQARKVLQAVYVRRNQRLAEIHELAPFAESIGVTDDRLWKITKAEARRAA
jgi:superfamily II DNA or RNA helicase